MALRYLFSSHQSGRTCSVLSLWWSECICSHLSPSWGDKQDIERKYCHLQAKIEAFYSSPFGSPNPTSHVYFCRDHHVCTMRFSRWGKNPEKCRLRYHTSSLIRRGHLTSSECHTTCDATEPSAKKGKSTKIFTTWSQWCESWKIQCQDTYAASVDLASTSRGSDYQTGHNDSFTADAACACALTRL